jgi:hypothetical protein
MAHWKITGQQADSTLAGILGEIMSRVEWRERVWSLGDVVSYLNYIGLKTTGVEVQAALAVLVSNGVLEEQP